MLWPIVLSWNLNGSSWKSNGGKPRKNKNEKQAFQFSCLLEESEKAQNEYVLNIEKEYEELKNKMTANEKKLKSKIEAKENVITHQNEQIEVKVLNNTIIYL